MVKHLGLWFLVLPKNHQRACEMQSSRAIHSTTHLAILNLGRTLESGVAFKVLVLGSQPWKFCFFGLGYGLGMEIFSKVPELSIT
jgi:hypothetical protein